MTTQKKPKYDLKAMHYDPAEKPANQFIWRMTPQGAPFWAEQFGIGGTHEGRAALAEMAAQYEAESAERKLGPVEWSEEFLQELSVGRTEHSEPVDASPDYPALLAMAVEALTPFAAVADGIDAASEASRDEYDKPFHSWQDSDILTVSLRHIRAARTTLAAIEKAVK